MKKKTKSLALLCMILMLPFAFLNVHPTNAQFIIASWDYPDEYGQGIRNVAIEQYIDGAWVGITVPSPPQGYYYGPSAFNISTGGESNGSLWIAVQCFLNATLCDISDIDDGPALIRHTITVSTSTNSSVFYQENFTLTYQTDFAAPLYFYQYEVFTDFVPQDGTTYTAIITYEVLY